MYQQPEVQDYQDEWIRAERDLAISSWAIWGLFPIVQEDSATDEDNSEPIEQHEKNKDESGFTRSDFIKDLKKASQRIEKRKSSPKPSKHRLFPL